MEEKQFEKFALIAFIIALFLFIMCCKANAQEDSLTIDYPLGEQLNYMANKARQYDTVVFNLKTEIEQLKNLRENCDKLIDKQDEDLDIDQLLLLNYENTNSILLQNNTSLRVRLDNKTDECDLCAKALARAKDTTDRLRSSRNNSLILNAGLAGSLAIAIYAILQK